MSVLHRTLLLAPMLAALAAGLPGQKTPPAPEAGEDPVLASDIQAFSAWLQDYKAGAVRLVKEDRSDEEAIAKIDAQMAKLAAWNTLAAAKMLFEAASIEPKPPGATSSTELIDYQRELQPWRIQTMASAHLRKMTGDGILPWLLQMLNAPGIRANKKNQDQINAAAVLRILGGHESVEAQLELLRACRSMPTELRVKAVNAMARDATLELVPTLIELLHDTEPNVRIAAANAIGTAMQPHVDESLGQVPTGEVLKLRDLELGKLEDLLVRDQIWQVRSAAAFALAIQKCKPVVPALIRGLEAELTRKKDPWAMDLRLHKLLEGLTGQTVVRGSIAPWKEFWAREGAGFTVALAGSRAPASAAADKYQKFFNLEIDSDRILFVLDFSGSMAEPVQLQSTTTGAAPGTPTTKAEIVVRELKKLIMSLPDGALVNLVVFSEGVRVWRQEGGRPALVKLDDETRDDLLGNFLDSLRPNGPTNLYGAMDKALDFAGRALFDKYYSAGFDTLCVISDGAPTAGAVVDKDEIRRRVREANQLRKITINCITFGDKNDTDFLKPMAEENGGRHIHVE
ncbi:MAG TPA: HEAT repeat domain-containing protein [Planctomycetota bacterium]|nr:HEAT repeat domain-containing protein [Planctomycetota bacterium]